MTAPGAPPRARRPGSPASLREANQRRVLDVLRVDRTETIAPDLVSQAQIARRTGLAPATVSNIVRDLAAAGVVDTIEGSGRRGSTVQISRRAGVVLGIDVGHTHVAVAVSDLAGVLLAKTSTAIKATSSVADTLTLIERTATALLTEQGLSMTTVRCVGLGLPAPVNSAGEVVASAIMPPWLDMAAPSAVRERLGRPTVVDNDANLGALAEHRRGAGIGHEDMVYVKVSSGVGAGLVVRGEIYRGADGTAGEIGHMSLDERGPLCRCGSRGCLEEYASTGVVTSMVAAQLPHADVAMVLQAAADGHGPALRVLEDVGLHLGKGLAALANLTNPSVIVVGGEMSSAGDLFLEPVRTGLRRHALASVASGTEVLPSQLGADAPVIGALLHALDNTDLLAEV